MSFRRSLSETRRLFLGRIQAPPRPSCAVATGLDVRPPVGIGRTAIVSGAYTNVTPSLVCGRGDGSEPSGECPDGRVVRFNALRQLNRSARTLSGDRLYLAWASHGDNRP